MVLVAFLQATQDGYGALLVGFVDHHYLEPSLQCLVFLKVLLVLVERGGTDAAQVAAGQGWLEDVGGIHGTAALAGTHQGVDLVDEQDDLALGLGDLVDDRLESLLKLALILGTGNQGTHVERVDLLLLQVLGHVAAHDALCQALDDGGLPRAGFTDQDGVVLGAAAQDLQHTTYFVITAYDGVEFALAGTLVKVDGIFAQCLVLLLGLLTRGLATLAQLTDGGLQILAGDAGILEDGRCGRLDLKQCHEQHLDGHILVALFLRQFAGLVQHLAGGVAQIGLTAVDVRQARKCVLQGAFNHGRGDVKFLKHKLDNRVALAHHGLEQMLGLDGLVTILAGYLHRLLDGLLTLDGKIIEVHNAI